MTMIKNILFTVLLGLAVAGNLLAAEPPPELRDVEVKIVLLDVDEVNNVAQTFTANLATAIRWQDHSLSHQGPHSISKPLDEIWYPSIQFLNQQRIVATFPRMAEVFPDGTVIYRQRYWGNFSQPLELKSFPFDVQKLTLTLAICWLWYAIGQARPIIGFRYLGKILDAGLDRDGVGFHRRGSANRRK